MRHLLTTVISLMILLGCSKPIDENSMVIRGEKKYQQDSPKPYTGMTFTLHENGQKASEGAWTGGVKDGKWTSWFQNGQRSMQGDWDNGARSGTWVTWYENGQQEIEATFVEGELVNSISWFRDGAKAEMVDFDGNVYGIVYIGNQIWSAENLKVTHYRDGTAIPYLTDPGNWKNTDSGAYCYIGNDSSEANTYGALYNWYAVHDSLNIAPKGWHVPTNDEWRELEMYLGMSLREARTTGYTGTNEGSKLAGNAKLWINGKLKNNSAFSNSDFNALPGGYRSGEDGGFWDLNRTTIFWCAKDQYFRGAQRSLNFQTSKINISPYWGKTSGYSVRLIRD